MSLAPLLLSLLLALPTWPDELGRLDAAGAAAERQRLAVAVSAEAHVGRALLALEPLPGRDVAAARQELERAIALADPTWSPRARLALAWLEQTEGRADRARGAYERLLLEEAAPDLRARALAGAARVLLHAGLFADGAARLQAALDAGLPPERSTHALRELAVRHALRAAGSARWKAPAALADTGVRDAEGMAHGLDGVLVLDERGRRVLRLDAGGQLARSWGFERLQAVAIDPWGRGVVVAGDGLWQLEEDGARALPPSQVASLGGFGPVSALAFDPGGRMWVLARGGDRIGRLDRGGAAPVLVWEDPRARLVGLGWGGPGLVSVDERSGAMVSIGTSGAMTPLRGAGVRRPAAMAVDAAGVVAVLDGRSGEIVLVTAAGTVLDRAPAPDPRDPVVAVATAPDGALSLLTRSGRLWSAR